MSSEHSGPSPGGSAAPPAPGPPPTGEPVSGGPAPGAPRLAGWGYRAAAFGVDVALVAVPTNVVAILTVIAGVENDETIGAVAILFPLLSWPMLIATTSAITGGQSPGKKLAGVRVVRESGRPHGFGSSLVRDSLVRGLFLVVPFANLADYLWPLGDRGHRTLHDKVALTHVVDAGPRRPRLRSALGGATGAGVLLALLTFAVVTSPGGSEPPGEYTTIDRQEFVEGCREGGSPSRRTCECRFDRIARTVPYDEFVEQGERLKSDPDAPLPPAFDEAIEACPRR